MNARNAAKTGAKNKKNSNSFFGSSKSASKKGSGKKNPEKEISTQESMQTGTEILVSNGAIGPGGGGALPGIVLPPAGKQADLLTEAFKHLGTPYVWGGYAPGGFDCSGYVSYCLTHSGARNTGHLTANGLLGICTPISKSNLKPGDLVFFQGTYNTSGASHVGIYVGSGQYGTGTFIHCGDPCKFGNLSDSYWIQHWYTGGRWY